MAETNTRSWMSLIYGYCFGSQDNKDMYHATLASFAGIGRCKLYYEGVSTNYMSTIFAYIVELMFIAFSCVLKQY